MASEVTIQDFGDLLAETALADRERMEAKVAALQQAREVKNIETRRDAALTAEIKQWLALANETEIVDGEHGVVAWVEMRGTGDEWDLISFANNVETAGADLLTLARMGLLKVDGVAFKRQRSKVAAVDNLDRMRKPAGESAVLYVDTIENRNRR